MNFKFSIIFGLIFFCFQSLFSQSDFSPSLIVNLQNDTIYGIGNVSKNQEYCLFKRFDAEEYTKYYPNELNAFRIIDGKYFVSREIKEENDKTKWYFLEFLVDGKIDLFVLYRSGRYFINKDNQDLLELIYNKEYDINIDGINYRKKDTRYLGYIKIYMSETPELFSKIDKMDYLDQRELVNLSIDYHNAICNEYECVNYTKKVPKLTYKFELLSGVTYHNSYYAPMAGFLVHVWRPLKNEKLYVKFGVIYSDKPHWKKDFRLADEVDYNIKFPLSFQYVFGKNDFKPTVAFGWPTGIILISSFQSGFIYSFSEKFEISVSGSIDGLFALLVEKEHNWLYENNLGHTISFGLIYNLK